VSHTGDDPPGEQGLDDVAGTFPQCGRELSYGRPFFEGDYLHLLRGWRRFDRYRGGFGGRSFYDFDGFRFNSYRRFVFAESELDQLTVGFLNAGGSGFCIDAQQMGLVQHHLGLDPELSGEFVNTYLGH
jgi:hypothetical protein